MEIRNIQEFIDAIRDFKSQNEIIWFRGHSKEEYKLVPGYYRNDFQTSEETLMIRFKQSASLLVENAQREEFDWMFLMQHYGVPTRLLDWTDSALVALYFCCSKNEKDNGAIWLLKPAKLNEMSNIKDENDGGYLPSFQDELLSPYQTNQLNAGQRVRQKPIAVIANRNNARLQAQLGNFTIHHNVRDAIEDIQANDALTKITVTAEAKGTLRDNLEMLGITKFQLFPELASVGEILKGSMT